MTIRNAAACGSNAAETVPRLVPEPRTLSQWCVTIGGRRTWYRSRKPERQVDAFNVRDGLRFRAWQLGRLCAVEHRVNWVALGAGVSAPVRAQHVVSHGEGLGEGEHRQTQEREERVRKRGRVQARNLWLCTIARHCDLWTIRNAMFWLDCALSTCTLMRINLVRWFDYAVALPIAI